MKGYKAFDKNWKCLDMQYEVGNSYEMDDKPIICEKGFHFCENLVDVFAYRNFDKCVVAEVEAYGDIEQEGTKFVTNKIRIIREIQPEILFIMHNQKRDNIGFGNSGNFNTGNRNSGNYNSGNYNSGKFNTGHNNIGNENSGHYNKGNCNTGCHNDGSCNTGNLNIGSFNSGDYNSGSFNTGCYNRGNYNTGFFNTTEPETVRLFNMDSGMTFPEFYSLRINFKDLEASKNIIMSLPNFDAEMFLECTGLDWRETIDKIKCIKGR